MSYRRLCKSLLTLGLLFSWISPLLAQNNRLMLLNEEWDTYTQTSNRYVNGWNFCKSGINDESIVQRANLHAYLSTGYSEGSGTTIATPWLAEVADTFSFYIYGSNLQGHTAQVEFGFIPDTATINDPSDICALFIPYDTVTLSVSNQWQRTTRDMHPYYAIHGTTHRFAIRLINSYHQELYLDEVRAWIPAEEIASCPNRTSKGRDFWAMFLYNHNYGTGFLTEEQRLYFLGDQTSSVTISNNNSGSTSATLSSPSFSATQLCGTNQQIVGTVYEGGYHITSSNDIWVYANDYIDCNQDAALVLPTEALGTRYIVQDYPSSNDHGAEVGFVATQDGTILTMTVPCNILGTSITSGTPLTVNLNRGQTYMLMAKANGSFSGMEVTSNGKPFAMFVAGQNTAVPLDGSGRDYTYEQALPVDLWGTEFIVSGIVGQSVNRLRITASSDSCIVYKNGTQVVGPLSAGQTWEEVFQPSSQCHLTATSPIQVILYLGSYQTAGNNGDPSSVTIPPLNRGICDVQFTSIASSKIPSNRHYVNIICHQNHDSGLLLDNGPLPSNDVVSILGDYRCHRVNLNPGQHYLNNTLGPFTAFAYGLGSWESYAYPLGIAIDTLPEEQQACQRGNGQGRDFWATFLCNDDDPANSALSLIATGAQQASVTVTNPVTGWTQTASMPAGGKVQINLPVASTIPSGQTHNIGYHITSTAPITLYACNFKEGSWDFAQVFPTFAIGDNYIVQNYPNNSDHPANVAFVATENGTNLSMVLPCTVTGLSLPAGSQYTAALDSGQSLMLRANPGGDFSGMEVSSNCKPFALFQGCAAGRVGDNGTNSGRDHFFEQALSPAMWGTEFVADASLNRSEGDRVVVTAGANNCTVQINGSIVTTLMRGQSYEHTLASSTTAHIITSQPSYACLYLVSYRNGGTNGDPGAATLPPVNRWVCHSDFMLHQCNNNPSSQYYIANPYINIIAENTAVGTLALDGTVIPASQFSPIAGTSFSHTRMHIDYGAHTLDAGDAGTFSARAYGLGQWVGFAYNIDMLVDTMERCLPQLHHDTITYSDSVCMGLSYLSPMEIVCGGTTYYPPAGLIYVRPAETAAAGTLERWSNWVEGDTLVHHLHLMLTVLPTYDTTVLLFLIPGDTLFFLGDTLTQACNRTYPLQSVYGCDSLVDLFLNYADVSLHSSSQGGCPGSEVILTAEGTHIYHWSSTPYDPELDSQQGQNPVTVHPNVTTTYNLNDASGYTVASVTVGVEPPPTLCIETNRDFIDFDYPVITLHDCSPDRYSSTWIFSDGRTLNGERARRQFSRPLPDTVTVTLHSCNRYGCCTDTTIGFAPKIRSVWFPNIFFPNQENNNVFGCYTSYEVAKFSLEIYNRWGLIVWRTTDIETPWDGTHKGKPVQQGAYVYKWFLEDIHGDRKTGTGTVTLIR